ncbi:MAG: hypothetical protein EOO75_02455 [Myxococcales bacterium]|nr:MAG: hypothetical protein EOO75_02455 [Myxococcales bacterium]
MATTLRPTTTDVSLDRSSTPPDGKSPPFVRRPRWAFPLLTGLALLTGSLTAMYQPWRGGHGVGPEVSSNGTSGASVAAPPAAGAADPTSLSEADEDAPLPGTLPFDEYVARKSLELRARGLRCEKPGQVELRVSFAPSGNATRTEVVSSSADSVASCITARLDKLVIPAFQGRDERSVEVSVAVR